MPNLIEIFSQFTIFCNSIAATILAVSLESCSKVNASADATEEYTTSSFLMTMSSKQFFTEVVYCIELHEFCEQ